MADAARSPRIKLGRATSWAFKLLFAVATILAVVVTYQAVTAASPDTANRPYLRLLQWINLALIAVIGGVLGLRVAQLMLENQFTRGGARLRLRIIFLFSVAAAIPTMLVAGFLAFAINRSVENWFSGPVLQIVNSARTAAQDTIQEVGNGAATSTHSVSATLDACIECPQSQDKFESLVRSLATVNQFKRADVLNSDRRPILQFAGTEAPAYQEPSESMWQRADAGDVGVFVSTDSVRAVTRLTNPAYSGAYLVLTRPLQPSVASRLALASKNYSVYKTAKDRRDELSTVLMLSYVEAGLLMLLGTAWLGMTAATRIAMPIGQLAVAARAVRDGNLNLRVPSPKTRDEIDDLAGAFNEMIDRLSRQTDALENGRIEAEKRTAFIEAVLAGVEAGVIRVDKDMKITIANASAQSLLGFIRLPRQDVLLAEAAPEFVSAARRAMDTGQSVEATYKRVTDAGALHFQVRAAPEAGRAGAVVTFHDATRLMLGQRHAAWRDVARRIAHEIRNPLTPIQLSAERLRRRFASQITTDRETFERCTDTILRQVADIGRMVEEFSAFARIPKPTFGSFNVVDMVQSVAFAQRMATPNIAINVKADPEPIRMLGDERMLAQSLTNVVKNAAEAVERAVQDGETKAGAVAIDLFRDGDEVQLTVRDNGPGFPVEDRERLLEPYVTTRKNGVGLGLAIVVRIVEDHGGRLWLGDNETGPKGARVDIRMPLEPPEREETVQLVGEGAA
jgi:two-component system nitrogen regulation sensor histidine kinase NtrY